MSFAYQIERFTDLSIQVTAAKSGLYTYIGPAMDSDVLARMASSWFSRLKIIKGDMETPLHDILDFTRTKYFREDQKSLWLEIRAGPSDPRYSVARPHMDGPFWISELNEPGEDALKVGAVLCGPATLLWNVNSVSEEIKDKANWLINDGVHQKRTVEDWPIDDYIGSNTEQDFKLRTWLAEQLAELGIKIQTADIGEAVMWKVRSSDLPAIHSEPDMSHMPEGRIL